MNDKDEESSRHKISYLEVCKIILSNLTSDIIKSLRRVKVLSCLTLTLSTSLGRNTAKQVLIDAVWAQHVQHGGRDARTQTGNTVQRVTHTRAKRDREAARAGKLKPSEITSTQDPSHLAMPNHTFTSLCRSSRKQNRRKLAKRASMLTPRHYWPRRSQNQRQRSRL